MSGLREDCKDPYSQPANCIISFPPSITKIRVIKLKSSLEERELKKENGT